MESLSGSLYLDVIPESWMKRAYPSLFGLSQWYADLLQRVKELESWVSDFQLPAAVWLAGFFNPQSFLTAIMQQVGKCGENNFVLIYCHDNESYVCILIATDGEKERVAFGQDGSSV